MTVGYISLVLSVVLQLLIKEFDIALAIFEEAFVEVERAGSFNKASLTYISKKCFNLNSSKV